MCIWEDEYHAIIMTISVVTRPQTTRLKIYSWPFGFLKPLIIIYWKNSVCLFCLNWFYGALAQYRSQSTKYASKSVNCTENNYRLKQIFYECDQSFGFSCLVWQVNITHVLSPAWPTKHTVVLFTRKPHGTEINVNLILQAECSRF